MINDRGKWSWDMTYILRRGSFLKESCLFISVDRGFCSLKYGNRIPFVLFETPRINFSVKSIKKCRNLQYFMIDL